MYKKFLSLAVIACSICAAQAAHADELNGWFVNGSAGSAHYNVTVDDYASGSDHGTAFIVNAGYRVSDMTGVEVGYTDLGSVSAKDGLGDHAKLSGDGWTLGFNGHFNPTDRWYISARGGAFLWKLHGNATVVDSNNVATSYSASKQSLGWYAGVGTGYDINRHWSVGANFDYYKMDQDGFDIGSRILSVSTEYRF